MVRFWLPLPSAARPTAIVGGVLCAVAAIGGYTFQFQTAYSIALGGGVALITSLWSTQRFARRRARLAPHAFLHFLYRLEAEKWLLAVAAFLVFFPFLALRPIPFFASYAMTLLALVVGQAWALQGSTG